MPAVELVRPLRLAPGGGAELTVVNRGSNSAFYGQDATVSSSNKTGTLAVGESLTLTKGYVWIVAEKTPVILDLHEVETTGPAGTTAAEAKVLAESEKTRAETAEATIETTANTAKSVAEEAAVTAASASGTSATATGLVSLENGERPIAANGEKAEAGEQARYVAVSPAGRHIYVTSAKSKTISIYERVGTTGLTLLGTVAAGTEPQGISMSPNGAFVHVCDISTKKVLCFLRNKFTGELKEEASVEVKNKGAAAAKIVHCVASPDSKYLYVVGEEEANKGNVYQFEIEATSKIKALTPELVGTTELGFCNWVAITPDGKSVYVGFEGGTREFSRVTGTGLLTNVATRGTGGGVGTVACSADNESVYSTVSGGNKLIEFSRNTSTGVLTEQGSKTVEKCQGVSISPDGKTVICTSTTLNEVFGFKRLKPVSTWELTAFATPSVAAEEKPLHSIFNPDGINAYVVNETSKTLQGFTRSVQTKVETQYVTSEGLIELNAQGTGVNGRLEPIKRVSQTSFYIVSSEPADTGKVGWSMPAEGPSSAAVEKALTLATLATFTKEQEWAGNLRGYSQEVMRYDMTNLTAHPVHPSNTELIKALKEGSRAATAEPLSSAKISKLTLLTQYAPEDFGSPIIFGKATDPEYTVKDAFTTQNKVHIPTGYQQAQGDGDLTVIDIPTGRILNIGSTITAEGSTLKCVNLSCHDFINGPGYSSNSKEHAGGEVQMSGAALVSGSATNETGGSSSARIEKGGYTVRFRQLNDADAAPFGPAQMMRITTRQKVAGVAGSGQAPITSTLFGEGIVVKPEDNRLPYVKPLAHQGEVSSNGSTNNYALPNGAIMRLNPEVWTQAFIEALNCPNWARWVYWCLRSRGGVVIDVQGQAGVELCRVESLRSYSYRSDTYATSWLEKHAKSDGAFCVQGEEHAVKTWRLDITGGGLVPHATIFEGLEVIKPPSSPSGFPN